MADGAGRDFTASDWANWSGCERAEPSARSAPTDLGSLRAAVTEGPAPVRVVGAGHSFTPVVTTPGTLITLDQFSPGGAAVVRDVDPSANSAWINAGARLHMISPALDDAGLAFKNLGDINVQTLAGATATATHGAGRTLPCLAAEIQAARLMTAQGEILEVSAEQDPDLLRAAQVSLGALGVLVEAKIALRPRFKLRRRTWTAPLEETLAGAEERWARHRNYEFFVIPHSGYAINVAHDLTDADETERPPSADEEGLRSLRRVRDVLKWLPTLRRVALASAIRGFPPEDVVGESWRLLSSDRRTLFNEMEYHLPAHTGASASDALDLLRALVGRIERERREVFFPIEVRRTAGDAAWLSPFQGGERISIAVHTHAPDPRDWLYTLAEPAFREAGGRPHWGKLHSLSAGDLEALYPDFDRFRALRRKLDPKGRFLNRHLAALFGEGDAAAGVSAAKIGAAPPA
ncbi:MAG: D-arabinono-1,4-lactone oxidase [Pseudomonadota bacterium]